MTIKRLLRIIAISSTIITVLLSVIIMALAVSQFGMNRVIDLTYRSKTAAEDIRRHSEYMQQLCRQYVMTGDIWWYERYYQEDGIRNGLTPSSSGETMIWLERYRSYNFTQAEFVLLEKHDQKLLFVRDIEKTALSAALSYFSEADRTFSSVTNTDRERLYRVAVATVFSDTYRAFFQIALNPLEDFVILIEQRNEELLDTYRRRTAVLLYFSIALALLGILWQIILIYQLGKRILNPILDLQQVFHGALESGLTSKATIVRDDEIGDLYACFNTMIGRIRETMDQMLLEQRNRRKAEFNIMQSQINPHFLYNSLDTIVWMAEINEQEKVVQLATGLSSFFRISLSKGQEKIPLSQELEHIENYLSIQKIRYEDTLSFEIRNLRKDLSPMVPKLILQPFVENAIYHGIKMKRGKGTVCVTVAGREEIEITIEDDGAGMDEETLLKLQDLVRSRRIDALPSSFGFFNTLQWFYYYYGPRLALSVDSIAGKGTRVCITFPTEQGHV
jgi:two-component system, sensor histidine kinase YesM